MQFINLVHDLFADEHDEIDEFEDEEEDKVNCNDADKSVFQRIASSGGQFEYTSKIDTLRHSLRQQTNIPSKGTFFQSLLDCYEHRPLVTCDAIESEDASAVFTALAQQYEQYQTTASDSHVAKHTVNEMLAWFDRYAKHALSQHDRYQAENQALTAQVSEQATELKQLKEKERALLQETTGLRQSLDEQNDVKRENQELRTKLQAVQTGEEDRVLLQTECRENRQKIEELQNVLVSDRAKYEKQVSDVASMESSLHAVEQDRKNLSDELEQSQAETQRLKATNATLTKQQALLTNKYTQEMEQKRAEFDDLQLHQQQQQRQSKEVDPDSHVDSPSDMVKVASSDRDESVQCVVVDAVGGTCMMDEDDKEEESQCGDIDGTSVPMGARGRVRTLSWDHECDTESVAVESMDTTTLTSRLKMYHSQLRDQLDEQRLLSARAENKCESEMKKMQTEIAEMRKFMEAKQLDEQDRLQRMHERMQTAMQEVVVKVESSTGEHVHRLQQVLLSKNQFEQQIGELQKTQLEGQQTIATEFVQLRHSMRDNTETNSDQNGNIQKSLQGIAVKMDGQSAQASSTAAETKSSITENVVRKIDGLTAKLPRYLMEVLKSHQLESVLQSTASRSPNTAAPSPASVDTVSEDAPYSQLKQEMNDAMQQQSVAEIKHAIQTSKQDVIASMEGMHQKWYSFQMLQNESKEDELYAFNTDLNALSDAEGALDPASSDVIKPCVLQTQIAALATDVQQMRDDMQRQSAEQSQQMQVSEVLDSLKQAVPQWIDSGVKAAAESEQLGASQICALIKHEMVASNTDIGMRIDGVRKNNTQWQQAMMQTDEASKQAILQKMDSLYEQYTQRQIAQKELDDEDDDDDDDMCSQSASLLLLQGLQPKIEEIIAVLKSQQTTLASVQNGMHGQAQQTHAVLQTMYSDFVQHLKQTDANIVSKIFNCDQDRLSSIFTAIETLSVVQNETLQCAQHAQQQGDTQGRTLGVQQQMVTQVFSVVTRILDQSQAQEATFTRGCTELQEFKRSKQTILDSLRQVQISLEKGNALEKTALDRVQRFDQGMDEKLTRVFDDVAKLTLHQESIESSAMHNAAESKKYNETLDDAIKLYIKEVDAHHTAMLSNMWQQLSKELDAKNTTMGQWYLQQMKAHLKDCLEDCGAKQK